MSTAEAPQPSHTGIPPEMQEALDLVRPASEAPVADRGAENPTHAEAEPVQTTRESVRTGNVDQVYFTTDEEGVVQTAREYRLSKNEDGGSIPWDALPGSEDDDRKILVTLQDEYGNLRGAVVYGNELALARDASTDSPLDHFTLDSSDALPQELGQPWSVLEDLGEGDKVVGVLVAGARIPLEAAEQDVTLIAEHVVKDPFQANIAIAEEDIKEQNAAPVPPAYDAPRATATRREAGTLWPASTEDLTKLTDDELESRGYTPHRIAFIRANEEVYGDCTETDIEEFINTPYEEHDKDELLEIHTAYKKLLSEYAPEASAHNPADGGKDRGDAKKLRERFSERKQQFAEQSKKHWSRAKEGFARAAWRSIEAIDNNTTDQLEVGAFATALVAKFSPVHEAVKEAVKDELNGEPHEVEPFSLRKWMSERKSAQSQRASDNAHTQR